MPVLVFIMTLPVTNGLHRRENVQRNYHGAIFGRSDSKLIKIITIVGIIIIREGCDDPSQFCINFWWFVCRDHVNPVIRFWFKSLNQLFRSIILSVRFLKSAVTFHSDMLVMSNIQNMDLSFGSRSDMNSIQPFNLNKISIFRLLRACKIELIFNSNFLP